MKRLIYLFLTLFTAVAYGQADFPEGVQISGGQPTTTTDPYITTTGSTGLQGKVSPINMPVTITPPTTFYTPVTSDLKGHLQGIDNALGDIPLTTAGNTTRVWFTGDATTIGAGTFYLTNAQNKGTVANVSQSVTNDDNQKKYFAQDLIGNAFATTTIFPPGVYAGNLSASTTPNSARQKFTVELYRCDTNGTPIASGVSGAPVGDLGVTVIIILDSGELTLADGSVTNVQVSASLASQLTVNAGERIRYHVSAEKVGTVASNITESVWYGSSFNSFLDVPTPITSSGVTNVSTVTGSSVTVALDNLKVADQAVAGAGVPYGHITDGAQTIYGDKSFVGNTDISGGLDIYTNGSRVSLTDTSSPLIPESLFHVKNTGFTTSGLRVSSYWQGSTATPYQNNDNILSETFNNVLSNSLNRSWSGSFPNAYNNIPVGVTDSGNRTGVLGWATSVSAPGYSHAGTLQQQVGIQGNAGFQGVSPSTAIINESIGVRGYIYNDSPGSTILEAKAGDFVSTATTGVVQKSIAISADASGGTLENYAFKSSVGNFSMMGNMSVGTVSNTAKIHIFSGTSSSADLSAINIQNGGENGNIIQFSNAFGAQASIKSTKLGGGVSSDEGVLIFSTATNSVLSEKMSLSAGGVLKVNDLSGPGDRSVAVHSDGSFYATATPPARPYLVYVALISQSGTSAPTATVLENTLGGTVVWSRDSAGLYLGTLSGAFTSGKTFCQATTTTGRISYHVGMVQSTSSVVQLATSNSSGTFADDGLGNTNIEIRVYP